MRLILLAALAASMTCSTAAARITEQFAIAPFGDDAYPTRTLAVDFALEFQGVPQEPFTLTAESEVAYQALIYNRRSLGSLSTQFIGLIEPGTTETRQFAAYNQWSDDFDQYTATFRLGRDPSSQFGLSRWGIDTGSIGMFVDVDCVCDVVQSDGTILYDQAVSRTDGQWVPMYPVSSTASKLQRIRRRGAIAWLLTGIEEEHAASGNFIMDVTLTRSNLRIFGTASYLPDGIAIVGTSRRDHRAAAAIPEPSTILLAMLAVAAWSFRNVR